MIAALCITAFLWPEKNARAQIADDTNSTWIDEEHPVVVELFTSSNCSACMLADRMLYDVSQEKNVIALGCHIDYWDKSTPKDPKNLEACTYRQWSYRSSGRMDETEVSIPHFMVNGRYSLRGSDIRSLYSILKGEKESSLPKPSFIHMKWKDKDTLLIEMPQAMDEIHKKGSSSVWLIRYQDYIIQKMTKGEVAGRVLRFTNVVQDIKHIAKWHGDKRTIEVDVPMPPGGKDRGGYVAVIHETHGAKVLAAGKVRDYKLRKKKKNPDTLPENKEDAAPVSTPMLPE